jgi:GGDEF domain-containing protein
LQRGDIAVRWGSTEFLVLLPGTDEAGLAATDEWVRMLMEKSPFLRLDRAFDDLSCRPSGGRKGQRSTWPLICAV